MNEKALTPSLQEFKMKHADLMVLKPQISISEPRANDISSPQIYVRHTFIFDNRLVPKEFNGVPVLNVTISSTIPACLNPSGDKPLWKVEDPNNYIQFVEDNSTLIRQELYSPSMTKLEMLNALTGGFEQHVMDWYKMVSDWFALAEVGD
jgi:hypothetical protein